MTAPLHPAGWYPDADDATGKARRFWDGTEWTPFRSEDGETIRPDIDAKPLNRLRLLVGTLVVIAMVALVVWLRAEPPDNSISFVMRLQEDVTHGTL